jgi:ATP-dependent exoDNAse (exonuclease V) alpha subunit
MAVFYQVVSEIKRGTFTCAVATAAYRSGSNLNLKLFDKDQSKKVVYNFDYSKKTGIAFSTILAPAYAPEWAHNRQILWQTVEDSETEEDAHLATELTIALPEELATEQNIDLIKEFAQSSFVSRGMIVDINFHNDHQNNPHLHVMFPTRLIEDKNKNGKFLEKEKSWTSQEIINLLKREQAQIINKYLEKYGHSSRVSESPGQRNRFDNLRPWL